MKPFLKWVGGKTKLLDVLFKHFPREIDTYYEPFLGGGSVLIALLQSGIIVKRIKVNDLNKDLIDVYLCIRDNPYELMNKLDTIIKTYESVGAIKYEKRKKFGRQTEDEAKSNGKVGLYYYYRDQYNNTSDVLLKSALFIFLNKTCFRGLYRVGKNGFNVPFGHYKSPGFYNRENMMLLSRAFKRVDFSSEDFEMFLKDVKDEDFVYLDPPYKDTFTGYNKDNFGKHEELLRVCKGLKTWLQSNSKCDYNEEKYRDYTIVNVDTKHAINSKNPGKNVTEILIVGR